MTTLYQDSRGFYQNLEDLQQDSRGDFRQDWKLCDCAGCGEELFGESMEPWYSTVPEGERLYMPHLIAGRMKERPYCMKCLIYRKKREREREREKQRTALSKKVVSDQDL